MHRVIRGVAFDHPRIVHPLRASAHAFMARFPEVRIEWVKNSLAEFEETSLCENSERYDIFAFDHPLIGDSVIDGCILDLEEMRPGLIADLRGRSVGLSLDSYVYDNSLFGIPFDGAAQNSAWVRSSFIERKPPSNLGELSSFVSQHGKSSVALPLSPAHSASSFLTIAASSKRITESANFLMEPGRLIKAYEYFSVIVRLSDPSSIFHDPISLLNEMSEGSPVLFSPYIFGYGIYASSSFSQVPLSFGPALRVEEWAARPILGGAGIAISSQSSQKELALDYLEFLVSEECMAEIVGQNHGQGGIEAGWGSGTDAEMKQFFFSPTSDSIRSAFVRPRHRGFVDFFSELGSYLTSSVQKQIDSDIAVKHILELFDNFCKQDPFLSELSKAPNPVSSKTPVSKFTGGTGEA